nr:hypothetical protein [Tanacetum cinerariifolium]
RKPLGPALVCENCSYNRHTIDRFELGLRKLLQIRHVVPLFIQYKIYSGKSTSVWSDKWRKLCLICGMITDRDIVRSGFSLTDSVHDLKSNYPWRWPPD